MSVNCFPSFQQKHIHTIFNIKFVPFIWMLFITNCILFTVSLNIKHYFSLFWYLVISWMFKIWTPIIHSTSASFLDAKCAFMDHLPCQPLVYSTMLQAYVICILLSYFLIGSFCLRVTELISCNLQLIDSQSLCNDI